MLAGAGANAQTVFAPRNVGTTSAPQTITVTAQAAGTVSSVQVLTLGVEGLDFAAGGGASTCASAVLTVGLTCTQSVTFGPTAAGARMGAVVLLNSANTVLGTGYLVGTGLAGLGVFAPGNMVTVAGVYKAYASTQDGIPAVRANLDQPSSVALDGAGNIYIADTVHNRIRMVTAETGIISTVAGNGNAAYTGDKGLAIKASLNLPQGVAVDSAGNIYIADTANNAIRKVAPTSGIITTVAGTGTAGYSGDNGKATAADLNAPLGISVDTAGNLYIADTANQRIREVNISTGIITTVAGDGFIAPGGGGGYSGDNGPAVAAELNQPYAVAFDAAGNMYIPDSANNRIREVDTTGTITTYAGSGVAGYSGDAGPATEADIHLPQSVAVDSAGNLYIADSQNSAIRKVSSESTHIIVTVAASGEGESLYPGAVSPAPVSLYLPTGLAIDAFGNVYLADYYYMLVRQIQSNFAALNYLLTPVRQGDVSAPQDQAIENDGTAALDLTAFTHDPNARINLADTTCNTGSPFLAINDDCVIAAEFAPSVPGDPLVGNIDIAGITDSSPLHLALYGDATPVNSTTVALTSNPNPSKWTQLVTFSASVTSGGSTGIPTGTVQFMDGAMPLGPPAGLNAVGSTVYATTLLTVGQHSITAVYSGDKGHTSNTSLPLIQVVDEVSRTSVVSSVNPSAVGANVTFTITVSAPDGGGFVPQGTVTLSDGAKTLKNILLNTQGSDGVGTYSTTTLAAGVHPITAVYSGDAAQYVLSSISAVLDQNVQDGTNTTLVSNNNPSVFGNAVIFTATVTGIGSSTPTGPVQFLDAGKLIGTANLTGNPGVASFTISDLSVGTHPITAAYQGGPGSGPSTSSVLDQKVTLGETSTTLTAIPNPGDAGKPVALTATVKLVQGQTTPTGSVTFTDRGAALATAPLGAAGTAVINPVLAVGTHVIVATYQGNTNDGSSSSSPLDVVIKLATSSVTVNATPNPAVVQTAIAFTAQVEGGSTTAAGNVTFLVDGKSIGTAALDANAVAILSYSGLAVGVHSVIAHYPGDADNSAGDSPALTVTVQAIPTVTALAASSGGGKQVILLATVVGAVGPAPTGTVTFTSGATVLGSAPLDASGGASITPNLAQGNYSIVANYGGDALHLKSSSNPVNITGSPAGFDLTVTPSSLTLATKQSATLTVDIDSNSGFSDTIGLGCGSLPFAVTCHFSKVNVNLAANGKQPVSLIIDTDNPLSGGTTAFNQSPKPSGSHLAGLFLPASAAFGFVFWRFRRRFSSILNIALVFVLSGAAVLVSGCGGFTQASAVPGKYVITVTGVGQNSGITHYQNVDLTITQ